MDPGKRTGSCAKNVTRLRKACLSTFEMSIPSIRMRPDSGRIVANSASDKVLLPDPVRPSSAVVDPPGMRKDKDDNDGSRWEA